MTADPDEVPKHVAQLFGEVNRLLDLCQRYGFYLERVIDGEAADVEAAEQLIAFVDYMKHGPPMLRPASE